MLDPRAPGARAALAALSAALLGMTPASLGCFTGGMALLLLLTSLWMEQQISRPIERMCQQALSVATGASHKVEQSIASMRWG